MLPFFSLLKKNNPIKEFVKEDARSQSHPLLILSYIISKITLCKNHSVGKFCQFYPSVILEQN